MAVTVSAGLQKKVGLPDYGSFGASCHVEFEIDRSMLDQNLDGFHQKVADAFAACRQAVNDQLAQPAKHPAPNGNGHSNGHQDRPAAGTATQSQVRAIFAIARRQRMDPQNLVQERFHRNRLEDLSIREASSLIDELKRRTTEVPS